MTDTIITDKLNAAQRAIADLLAAANGGTDPDRISLKVIASGDMPDFAFDEADPRDRLIVTVGADGRLSVSAGIATHWTLLWHHYLRFARSPGGQLFLLDPTVSMHAWIEDGRLWCDRGSPLLARAADRDAMAHFDVEFATRTGEAL